MDGLLPIKHYIYIVGLHGLSIAMFQYQSVCSYFKRKKENTGKSSNMICFTSETLYPHLVLSHMPVINICLN